MISVPAILTIVFFIILGIVLAQMLMRSAPWGMAPDGDDGNGNGGDDGTPPGDDGDDGGDPPPVDCRSTCEANGYDYGFDGFEGCDDANGYPLLGCCCVWFIDGHFLGVGDEWCYDSDYGDNSFRYGFCCDSAHPQDNSADACSSFHEDTLFEKYCNGLVCATKEYSCSCVVGTGVCE